MLCAEAGGPEGDGGGEDAVVLRDGAMRAHGAQFLEEGRTFGKVIGDEQVTILEPDEQFREQVGAGHAEVIVALCCGVAAADVERAQTGVAAAGLPEELEDGHADAGGIDCEGDAVFE